MGRDLLFPEELERLLVERALGSAALSAAGRIRARDLKRVTEAVLELSDWFNGLAQAPEGNYMDSRWHRAAYLLYFFPANFVKMLALARELEDFLDGREELSVLDLGSGPGSLSLGLYDSLARRGNVRKASFAALDTSREALQDWRFLLGRYGGVLAAKGLSPELTMKAIPRDAVSRRPVEGPWDVILMGDLLVETFYGSVDHVKKRAELVASYAETLSDGGRIVIVEPALKATARDLQRVRDILAAEYGLEVLAPCLIQGPCPMLSDGRERDWCHGGAHWQRPAVVRQIDELIRRKKTIVKFSYLVVGRAEEALEVPGAETFRMVGDIVTEKGKSHGVFCGEAGCVTFTLLSRNEGPATGAFGGLERGDVVEFSGWEERKDGARLTSESTVKVVRRFAVGADADEGGSDGS